MNTYCHHGVDAKGIAWEHDILATIDSNVEIRCGCIYKNENTNIQTNSQITKTQQENRETKNELGELVRS